MMQLLFCQIMRTWEAQPICDPLHDPIQLSNLDNIDILLYRAEIQRMHNEILDYLTRHSKESVVHEAA